MSEWAVEKTSSRRKKREKRTSSRKDEKSLKRKKRKIEHEKSSRKVQKAVELEFRYKTSLPPPIGHPKLLEVPLPPDYLTRYMGAELETQRHWHLQPESGFIVPIDIWDPNAYKPNIEEKERGDEDSDLLAMIYQRRRNASDVIDHKLNKSHYFSMNKVSWTLNPDIMTNTTRVREFKCKSEGVREVDTKFADKSVIEDLMKRKESLLSVDAIQQSFKDIDNLKHPTKPELTVVEALPIFPDDRILENSYSHMSFDWPPMKEAIKLSFLQERSDQECHEATKNSMLRVSENHGKDWYSLYTPDQEKGTELDQELEWTSEYHLKYQGKADFSHFFVRVDNEIVWGQVHTRTKLGRVETENIMSRNDKTLNRAERDTFASLPRYLGVETIPDENEDEDDMSEEEEAPPPGETAAPVDSRG